MIPKRVIQFWDDKSKLPNEYKEVIDSNEKYIDGFKHLFVDDVYISDFLKNKNPFLYEVYTKIRIAAIRSDIARLVLLYEYGGIYMDMSISLKAPLEEIVDSHVDVALLRRDDQLRYAKYPEHAHIGTMFLASSPKQEFIKECIHKTVDTIVDGFYNHHVLFGATKNVNDTYRFYKNNIKFQKTKFDFLSFKKLKKDYLIHLRIKGLANSWSYLEEDGIIEPSILQEIQNEYKKRYIRGFIYT